MVRWTSTFREAVEALKVDWPLIHPVRVRLVNPKALPDSWADCDLVRPRNGGEPYFLIRLARTLCEPGAILLLSHEWAHALYWNESDHLEQHPPEFGIIWARTYTSVGHN